MGWEYSDRKYRLPGDWKSRRKHVLLRDRGRCQIGDPNTCTVVATEVDHIIAGDDHSYYNLQAVCHACHAAKTARESKRVPRQPKKLRKHPGWLNQDS